MEKSSENRVRAALTRDSFTVCLRFLMDQLQQRVDKELAKTGG